MSIGVPAVYRSRFSAIALLVSVSLVAWSSPAIAQTTTVVTGQRAVGGVSVDPSGILENVDVAARAQLAREVADVLRPLPRDSTRPPTCGRSRCGGWRRPSKRRRPRQQLPEAIHFLGGLEQIDYVVVSPEDHDILLVGPGEAWKVGPQGAVVGATSGRPVMLLDDLVVAFHAANAPTHSVIICSIEPTQEGSSDFAPTRPVSARSATPMQRRRASRTCSARRRSPWAACPIPATSPA